MCVCAFLLSFITLVHCLFFPYFLSHFTFLGTVILLLSAFLIIKSSFFPLPVLWVCSSQTIVLVCFPFPLFVPLIVFFAPLHHTQKYFSTLLFLHFGSGDNFFVNTVWRNRCWSHYVLYLFFSDRHYLPSLKIFFQFISFFQPSTSHPSYHFISTLKHPDLPAVRLSSLLSVCVHIQRARQPSSGVCTHHFWIWEPDFQFNDLHLWSFDFIFQ